MSLVSHCESVLPQAVLCQLVSCGGKGGLLVSQPVGGRPWRDFGFLQVVSAVGCPVSWLVVPVYGIYTLLYAVSEPPQDYPIGQVF